MIKGKKIKQMNKMRSHAQRAYEAIKADIVSQKLKPGSFISESEYANQIGMSRTPVREALKALANEGLIDIYPRKGVQVKNFTLQDLILCHEAAEGLDGTLAAAIAEKAARGKISEEDFAALYTLVDQMDQSLESGDMQKWVSYDYQFHNKLISLCDNPYIVQYVSTSRNRLNLTLWFMTPKYIDKRRSNIEHKTLADAVREGNPAKAREAAQMHIFRIRKELMGIEDYNQEN
jgi:DNA-binding GntR family transcriptional regulator